MIVVTGASGGLGNLVLERMAPDAQVTAGSRTPELVTAKRPARRIDFDDPMSLATGFEGAEVILLISAGYGDDDVVIARHKAAIDAAEQAGVRHIVNTSLTAAGDHLAFALPHRWTERRLMAGRVDWTILRNGIYAEMSIPDALDAASTGSLTGPLGGGRLAAVAREDLADVTASLLADPAAHRGKTYELVGGHAIGGADLADTVAAVTETDITYAPTRWPNCANGSPTPAYRPGKSPSWYPPTPTSQPGSWGQPTATSPPCSTTLPDLRGT